MRAYAAYGRVLTTGYVLPELPSTTCEPGAVAALTISAGPPTIDAPQVAWTPPATPDATGGDDERLDDPWLTVDRTAGGFLLRFGTTATFSLSWNATHVSVHGAHHEGPLPDAVRHLLIDQVVPLALAHQGALVLHASALVVDGVVAALVGPSGVGKSTLAASLAYDDCALLADDALLVEPGGIVQPSYPGLRLWPDVLQAVAGGAEPPLVASYSEKRRVGPGGAGFVDEPRELRALYVIDEEEHERPAILPLSQREAAMALLQHSYVLDPGDTARLRAQFRAACDLLDRIAVRQLRYPRALDRLPEVRACVRTDLATRAERVPGTPGRPPLTS